MGTPRRSPATPLARQRRERTQGLLWRGLAPGEGVGGQGGGSHRRQGVGEMGQGPFTALVTRTVHGDRFPCMVLGAAAAPLLRSAVAASPVLLRV